MTGTLQAFKRGAFTLAAKSGVPVVPMIINNTFGIMPKGRLQVKKVDISVVLEKPISTVGLETKTDEMELSEHVHQAIENHYVNQS